VVVPDCQCRLVMILRVRGRLSQCWHRRWQGNLLSRLNLVVVLGLAVSRVTEYRLTCLLMNVGIGGSGGEG